ncbi:MAG TPA: hypothetical protein VG799_08100 [Gemmatimonadota bacterium]|jgi:hypothetical protein|nr:hypothetical protein [Gemmatimonadota bacterium]
MGPKRFGEMETGDTMMLASEIMERTSVSQVYEKMDARTIRQVKTGEIRQVSDEELVYPFQPDHAAPAV